LHPGVKRIAVLMAPAVLGVAAVQIAIFVNTRFAGDLGDGAVSQLRYAFRLFFLPLGMFGVALATVTTTSVSEAAADEDRAELARRAAESISAGFMLTAASAVGLWVLAEPVVALIYRHGETSSADATAIAIVLQSYVLGLVPYSLIKIIAPAFFSVDRPRIPLLASAVGVAVNVTFNALTYKTLGAPGIAFGTALGATTNVVILRIAFSRTIAKLPSEHRWRRLGALVVANAAMGGAVWGAWVAVERGLALVPDALRVVTVAVALATLVGLGFVVNVGVLRALRYPGATLLWSLPRRLLGRLRRRA
jgi:putative peptidoglycan lipid II flippase